MLILILNVLLSANGAFRIILHSPLYNFIRFSFNFMLYPLSSNWHMLTKLLVIKGKYNTSVMLALRPFLLITSMFPFHSGVTCLLSTKLITFLTDSSNLVNQFLFPVMWLLYLKSKYHILVCSLSDWVFVMSSISSELFSPACAYCTLPSSFALNSFFLLQSRA